MKNRYLKGAHLSERKVRELIKLFSEDLTATQIANITGISRITVNAYFKLIRTHIAKFCEERNPFHFTNGTMVYHVSENGEVASNGEASKKSFYGIFKNDETIYTDKTTMVLSLQAYRDLLEAGKAKINWDGEDIEFKAISHEDYTFEKGNGQIVEKVIYCANDSKTKEFWVWKNPELPLIMKLHGSPSIELTYWYLPGEHP